MSNVYDPAGLRPLYLEDALVKNADAFSEGTTDLITYEAEAGIVIINREVGSYRDRKPTPIFISHTCGACAKFIPSDNVRLKLLASGFTMDAIKQISHVLEKLSHHNDGE